MLVGRRVYQKDNVLSLSQLTRVDGRCVSGDFRAIQIIPAKAYYVYQEHL